MAALARLTDCTIGSMHRGALSLLAGLVSINRNSSFICHFFLNLLIGKVIHEVWAIYIDSIEKQIIV